MTEQDYKEKTAAVKESGIPLQMQKELQVLIDKEFNNGWIPCSKRLPKYDEDYFGKYNNNHRQYIVMCKGSYEPTVAYFSKEKTWYYNDFIKFNDVIAWQPLPEPYKEIEK